jgi:hypothetical protein
MPQTISQTATPNQNRALAPGEIERVRSLANPLKVKTVRRHGSRRPVAGCHKPPTKPQRVNKTRASARGRLRGLSS